MRGFLLSGELMSALILPCNCNAVFSLTRNSIFGMSCARSLEMDI